jgi:hypothetical protein
MEEINVTAYEDITITQFNDQEQVKVNVVDAEFHQQNKLHGDTRDFTLFNQVHCYQAVHLKHRRKYKYRVNLTYLSPKPKSKFELADGWLITACIAAVLSFMLIYIGWFSNYISIPQLYLTIAATGLVTLTILAFMMTWLKTRNYVVLVSRFGNIPLLEFLNKRPDKASFDAFLEKLGMHIVSAQHAADLNTKDRCTEELKELRRLRDEQILTSAQYELGKKRIFNNKAFKA